MRDIIAESGLSQGGIFQEKSLGFVAGKVEEGCFSPHLALDEIIRFTLATLDGIIRDSVLVYPGIPMLLIAAVLANPIWGFGIPIVLALMIAATIGLLPTLWLIMIIKAQDRAVLMAAVIMNFLVQGLIGPISEEYYFRGFLLPRMGRLGKAAPITNIVLFSAYHLFTPWENITRILALTPYVYLVWRKRNIYIGVVAHCTLNLLSAIAMLPLVL